MPDAFARALPALAAQCRTPEQYEDELPELIDAFGPALNRYLRT